MLGSNSLVGHLVETDGGALIPHDIGYVVTDHDNGLYTVDFGTDDCVCEIHEDNLTPIRYDIEGRVAILRPQSNIPSSKYIPGPDKKPRIFQDVQDAIAWMYQYGTAPRRIADFRFHRAITAILHWMRGRAHCDDCVRRLRDECRMSGSLCDRFVGDDWSCDSHCYLYDHCLNGQESTDLIKWCKAFRLSEVEL